MTVPDWGAWSAAAVALMGARNRAWIEHFCLSGAAYHWDLATATLEFKRSSGPVRAEFCLVGTAAKTAGTFLWSWANEAIPSQAKRHVERVRKFGERNDLPLLTTPEWRGGRAEGLEMLAVAARVLDGAGAWVDDSGDLTTFLVLFDIRSAAAPVRFASRQAVH